MLTFSANVAHFLNRGKENMFIPTEGKHVFMGVGILPTLTLLLHCLQVDPARKFLKLKAVGVI